MTMMGGRRSGRPGGGSKLKLLVVEDHALVREGMLLALRRLERDIELLESGDAAEVPGLMEANPDLDLVLLDLRLPDADGLGLLRQVRTRFPMVPVLVVSGMADLATVNRSIRAGASGFVPKSCDSGVLLDAVRAVLEGGIFVPDPDSLPDERRGNPLPSRRGKNLDLTMGQRRVFDLLVQGLSNREIGEQLGLTEGTVKVHVSHIFRTLGISSRSQAVVVAARLGMKV